MRFLLFVVLICLFGCSPSNSQAQTKSNTSTLQQSDVKQINGYIDNFFKKYKTEGSSNAIDYIFSTNKITVDADNLKSKLDSIKIALGSFTGYSLITEKSIANGLALRSYLVKHENHPLRFTFVFYKPRDIWVLYKFLYDAEAADELTQSAKIYLIN
ncbi:hypothetical protein [Mucilaginibacter ginsenosidivorans]|uniref:Nuclear transport factor 2 family protein n=1 Tax=Mucilaginibacter ginsenosidivorans TaxID=398053 RepID=A0A5B8UZI7_9SPHI|nr:hypothetical protein [Mucilaginibacter ginsenosidivorans]QEC64442.1 hypothetical protein FRZ54_18290 [Mucilaginibacter ginsenosidivorans]